jgi:3-methyladenine DNA glycosylase AlkC
LLANQPLSFKDKLNLMTRLAEDQNSGVREWAWLAIRPDFAKNLPKNIPHLIDFTCQSPNLRRFASELSRPRGVWCKHIVEFKEEPWLGLGIIEPMKSDESKYVQLSVGNWLNDASKSQASWVKKLCLEWQTKSPTNHTYNICKRAQRTINKIPRL